MPKLRPLVTAWLALLLALTGALAFAQAEDWAAIEEAALQEGKLMVYSTTSRTVTAGQNFQERPASRSRSCAWASRTSSSAPTPRPGPA